MTTVTDVTTRWLSVPVRDYPAWLASLHAEAARRLSVTPVGEPTPSASLGVTGGPVLLSDDSTAWLRVAPFVPGSQDEPAWRGSRDAATLTGVLKPALLEAIEWTDTQHAPTLVSGELMTRVVDPVIQPGDQYLSHDPGLSDQWWVDLRTALVNLAVVPARREIWWYTPDRTRCVVHAAYGELPASIRPEWATEHLDLHWGNLTAPACWILDWEHWGVGVVGSGAARLYCTALAVPAVAEQVHATFADVLDSPSGKYAQLVIAADILNNLAAYPDPVGLAPALRELTHRLLA